MSREIGEIIEDLNDSKEHLEQLEKEVTHAESFRNDAKTEFENIKHELETTNYVAFSAWQNEQTDFS